MQARIPGPVVHFPVSGVTVSPLMPALVSLGISALTSTAGVSGAFLLLPFQVSVLGFVSPAVTPTNHLFNVVAIPSGVYRYVREGRMVWPLAGVILAGTVPGVIVGSLARIYLLPDARSFKLFVGLVLLAIGGRMARKALGRRPSGGGSSAGGAGGGSFRVELRRFDWRRLEYRFGGELHGVSTPALLALTAVVGVVGGTYGVGGGAIIAPVLVSLWGLPIHTIAGATLSGTCLTSIVGVAFFALAGPLLGHPGLRPDWALGLLLGAGGLLGMYTGARLQRFLPARAIEVLLTLVVLGVALRYVVEYFL
jgi:uncharacterized membrane protein YfcA